MLGKVVLFLLAACSVHTDHLTEDIVRKWASQIEDYLTELAEEGLRTKELQNLYDSASYVVEPKNGKETVQAVKEKLGGYFLKKEKAAKVFSWFVL